MFIRSSRPREFAALWRPMLSINNVLIGLGTLSIVVALCLASFGLTIYQFSRHSQSFGNGRARSISLTAVRRPRVNQDSLLLASFLG